MIKLVAVVLILASLDQAKSVGTDCVEPGTDDGASYRGDVAVSESGQVCLRWDSKAGTSSGTTFADRYPDAGLDENFCRNPDESGGPWCFIYEGTTMWELCPSTKCSAPCDKPDIDNGNVEPDSATINSGINYDVTCNDGFVISGITPVTCTNGVLSTVPTCQPVPENDGNDNGETDGNDNGETENTNKNDYSGAGYTNISTILFGTLMCKIVLIY